MGHVNVIQDSWDYDHLHEAIGRKNENNILSNKTLTATINYSSGLGHIFLLGIQRNNEAINYIFGLIWRRYGPKRDILDYWGTILYCLLSYYILLKDKGL